MPKRSKYKLPLNKIFTTGIILLLPLFLTGCTLADLPYVGKYFGGGTGGGANPVSSGSANLTVWGLWENSDVVNLLDQKFTEQNPDVTVNYDDRSVFKPLVDYKERAFVRAADETGPDVMRVHVSWVPSMVDSLVPMPDGMMSVDDFKNNFYPVATKNLIIDGKIYGVPTYYDGLVLVYNKDQFAEVGQTEPPSAWEEFRRLALELTVRGGDDNKIVRAGAAIGSADNIDFFSDILGLLFAQARVSVPNDVDGKAAQDALAFYTNFVLEDKVWSNDFPEASVAFSQGRVSMIFVPVWNLADIVAARPDMNIGVAPVPQALPNDPASWGTFWVDVVPSSSKNPQAAWSYINFMASQDQQLLNFSETSKYKPFGSPYSLVSLAPELKDNPYLNPVLESASYAETGDIAGRAGNRRQVDALKTAVNKILQGPQRNYQSVLTEAKTELSR